MQVEKLSPGAASEKENVSLFIGTIHLFLQQEYFLINIQIEFKITACLHEYIGLHGIYYKKKSVLIYVINGKTFGQRKTNF